ncbi:MAG: stage IV sporulation protein A [Clostridia bacterium]|nr:stage IV sporulation protein A [Clostridia bacterium]
MQNDTIYKDIEARTKGNIYIGVVGPVRSGKSTFIKKFMDELVIPKISDEYAQKKAKDELPQSSAGRAVMTTEPKFIPDVPIELSLSDGCKLRVRMIDSVGFMIPGATAESDGNERMVSTPWSEEAIPFSRAAEIGTQKVIRDHSTIGLMVTSDGTVGEIPRVSFTAAEEKTVNELKALGRPFAIILNSASPDTEEAIALAMDMEERYRAPVALVNCLELSEEDIHHILELVLMEFPVTEICFRLPKWTSALEKEHWLNQSVKESILLCADRITKIRDVREALEALQKNPHIKDTHVAEMNMGRGIVTVKLDMAEELYYQVIGELTGIQVRDDEELFRTMKELSSIREEYEKYSQAIEEVNERGYGIVMPAVDDFSLEEPEVIKQSGSYGIKLRAKAPSIHMIRTAIETEINPIIGTEGQSEEVARHLSDTFAEDPASLWDTNLFGKSLYEMMSDGLRTKIGHVSDEAQARLSETLSRVINEGSGGLLCIIL